MVSMDAFASAFGLASRQGETWFTLGKVTAVNGSKLSVLMGGSATPTECEAYCLAGVGDVVLIIIKDGAPRAIACKGGGAYLPLAGGTLTGDLFVSHSNINAKAANNGVSSGTVWPPIVQGYDSDGHRTSFFGEAIKSDGGIASGIWTYNYDTSGNPVGSNSLYVGMNKDGTGYYGIGDTAAFLTALGIGTSYEANKDSIDTTANQDAYEQGAKITLPAGKYVIYTQWTFGSTSSAAGSTTVGIGSSSGIWNDSRDRIRQADAWFTAHSTTYICTLNAQYDVYSYGSSSIARSGCGSFIRAIKIG